MRRLRLIIAALTITTALAASPVSAAPPVTVLEPAFLITLNEELRLVSFWNITRQDFCEWEAGGFVGDPPVTNLIPSTEVETGKGAIVGRINASAGLEVWALDEDADLTGPCQDTDDQSAPWGLGSMRWNANDNDLDVTLTRTNAFGDRAHGVVFETATGAGWAFSWTFQATIDRDETFWLRADNLVFRPLR